MAKFEIRNKDSLDTRDAKMPPELVKAFYDLKVKSILDIACGSGWICDYMPPGTRYVGFDMNETAIKNAEQLHPEGEFVCTTIEAVVADAEAALSYTQEKFDCAFLKCVFCVVNSKVVDIVKVIKTMVSKYVFVYDTEKEPGFWMKPFVDAGFKLIFHHIRVGSKVEIWSIEDG